MINALDRFKSHISQDVYQAQISNIKVDRKSVLNEKRIESSSIIKSTELTRKIFLDLQIKSDKKLDKNNENLVDSESQRLLDNELLEYTELKSELDKTFYHHSLIKHRQNSIGSSNKSHLSFMSDVQKEENENARKKFAYSFRIYKEITVNLEKHLKDVNNALGYLMNEFNNLSIAVAKGNLLLFKDESNILQEFYDSFTVDIRNFLEILQETLCLYYNIEQIAEVVPEFVFLTKENLISFLTNHLFNSELYDCLMEYESRLSRKAEEKLQKSIFTMQYMTTKDFSIPKSLLNPLKSEPFKDSIEIIRTLNQHKSPLQKLKIILKTAEAALKEIEEIVSQPVTGDDVLLIFLYILVKAKPGDLVGQLNLIDKYAGKGLLMTKSGYYFATVQICVKHLQEDNCKDMGISGSILIESLKRISEAIPSWKKIELN